MFRLQDDMTVIRSAAALNRSWNELECTLAEAGHKLRRHKCGVWAPRFEHFEDQALPLEIRNLCTKVPRKRLATGLLGSAANVPHTCMLASASPLRCGETGEGPQDAGGHRMFCMWSA